MVPSPSVIKRVANQGCRVQSNCGVMLEDYQPSGSCVLVCSVQVSWKGFQPICQSVHSTVVTSLSSITEAHQRTEWMVGFAWLLLHRAKRGSRIPGWLCNPDKTVLLASIPQGSADDPSVFRSNLSLGLQVLRLSFLLFQASVLT